MNTRHRRKHQGRTIGIQDFCPEVLNRILPAREIELLAREHIRGYRARRLPASAVVMLLVCAQVWRGVTSLSEAIHRAWEAARVCIGAGEMRNRRRSYDRLVSVSALSQRQNTIPPAFFAAVLRAVIARFQERFQKQRRGFPTERSIFALDATQVGKKKTKSQKVGRKLSAVLDLGSYLVTAWKITPAEEHEVICAKEVLRAGLAPTSIVFFDRGYCDFGLFCWLRDQQHDFVTRFKTSCRHRVVRSLGSGDQLIEIGLGRKDPVRLRRVRVRTEQGERFYLLTSLLDLSAHPAEKIRELYIQRWQVEILFRNLKHVLTLQTTLVRKANGRNNHILAALIASAFVEYLRAEAAEINGSSVNELSLSKSVQILRTWLSCDAARVCRTRGRRARRQAEDLLFYLAIYARKTKRREPSQAGKRTAQRA